MKGNFHIEIITMRISGTKSKLDNANTAYQLVKGVISQNLVDFLQTQVTLSVTR